MRVLDLFSGLGGFSQAFKDRGHEVVTVDNDGSFKPTITADIRKIQYPSLSLNGKFDVVLASPPCNCFSVLTIHRYWPGHIPTPEVIEALGLVTKTFILIAQIKPRYWVLENPRAMLRRLIGPPKETIFQCSFGNQYKKPTDLWGVWPGKIARPCVPHESAPRGSKEGAMRIMMKKHKYRDKRRSAEVAKLPYELSLELCKRFENGGIL